MNQTISKLKVHIDYAKKIAKQSGPNPKEYNEFAAWFQELKNDIKKEILFKDDIHSIKNVFGETFQTDKTLAGFVCTKPHGYAGDYEIIEKIYRKDISYDPRFMKYDLCFQTLSAVEAVRNRKEYFKNILSQKIEKGNFSVLNLASGPCRGIKELLHEKSLKDVSIHCIDMDRNAIQYAQNLLPPNKEVTFDVKNILKFKPDEKYNLIWSAGLFDYFDDKTFVRILTRFLQSVEKEGEMIIGNFHPRNTSRAWMEFGEWNLHHRTNKELFDLAQQAGVQDTSRITIEEEAEGVNLFMRIKS